MFESHFPHLRMNDIIYPHEPSMKPSQAASLVLQGQGSHQTNGSYIGYNP